MKNLLHKFHIGYFVAALIIAIGVYYLSIWLFPDWNASIATRITLAGATATGVTIFFANFRKAFWKQDPVKLEVTTLPPTPTIPISPPTLNPLHQLPAPPADFTGREAELAELLGKIKEGGVTITGVRGMGGIGKTALALVLADQLKEEYPDAQFYLDLRGVAEEGQVPVTTPEALAHVIRAYHPAEQLPDGEEELQALYNSVLHDQRALLLMDNALDAAQVGPLIPPPGNTLLVTSRQKFTLPGLYPTDLDILPPEEARALVQKIAPRVDDACADEIAKLCGCLPVALRLAATALAETIDLRPENYLEDLQTEQTRQGLVDASLSMSVKLLDEELETRWYALGVFPESFDRGAAATVWALEEEAAQENLNQLVKYSLVDWDEASGRYRLHDLALVFARAQIEEDKLYEAKSRFATHYLNVLIAANKLYQEGEEDLILGLTLYDLEADNIHSGQDWANTHGTQDRKAAIMCSYYTRAWPILNIRLHPRQYISWFEAGLKGTQVIDDKDTEGSHLGGLGTAYHDLGEYEKAIEYHQLQLEICRQINNRFREAVALNNLGTAHIALGDPKTAIKYHKQALEIAREIGDRRAEGHILGNLGSAQADLGDPKTAIKYHEQALTISRETGDRRGEGQDLGNLGNAHRNLGDPKKAIGYHEQALEISREIGDRRNEGNMLGGLGNAHFSLGDPKTAIKYHEQALDISREIGDRRAEGQDLGNLGSAHYSLGNPKTAIKYYQQALEISREIGDRRNEGNWLGNLGITHFALGDPKTAIKYHEQALAISREIGDRSMEATTSWNLGDEYRKMEEFDKAVPLMQVYVEYLREIGHPDAEEQAKIVEELKKGLE